MYATGYYFDKEMVKNLFSEKWIDMIDFKKTLKHPWKMFRVFDATVIDEKSYWENEEHNYKGKINDAKKQIEIYIDWKLTNSFRYNEWPEKESFKLLRRLNTLYKQNRCYKDACEKVASARRLLERETENRDRTEDMFKSNMDYLKELDATICIEDEKYKDYMLQFTETTFLSKDWAFLIYQSMDPRYINWTIEDINMLDELAIKKIKLFDKFAWHNWMTFSRWAFEELPGVRPYILLKYLQQKAYYSKSLILQNLSDYIGSTKPEDMDPNDERIKEVNLSRGAIVARFMNE